jgi:hypothetical protein
LTLYPDQAGRFIGSLATHGKTVVCWPIQTGTEVAAAKKHGDSAAFFVSVCLK